MSAKLHFDFFIHMYTLLFCLSVCLYPINVKTTSPIRPKYFVGPRVTPEKVYGWSNFQKFASYKIFFENFENPQIFGVVFVLQFTQGDWEHVHDWKRRGRKAPLKPGTYTNKKQTLLQVAYHPLSKKGLCTVHNYYVSCLLDF